MNRTVALASLLWAAFMATIALTSNAPGNFAIMTDSSRVDVLVYSAAAGATLGAITAAFTVILARRPRTLASIAALGLVLLAVTSFHGFWQWEFYPQRVGGVRFWGHSPDCAAHATGPCSKPLWLPAQSGVFD